MLRNGSDLRTRRVSRVLAITVGIVAIVMSGCVGDLILSTSNLQVNPNPAVPGQTVVFTFILTVVPEHSFRVVALVDDLEHTSKDYATTLSGPFDFVVGTADELIAQYGVGEHTARVEIRLLDQDNVARSAAVSFELAEAP